MLNKISAQHLLPYQLYLSPINGFRKCEILQNFKFMTLTYRFRSYRVNTILIPKILKGHNSAKSVGAVLIFLFSAYHLMVIYICIHVLSFLKISLTVFKLQSRRFSYQNFKGA